MAGWGMARKKQDPVSSLPVLPAELLDAFEGAVGDAPEAVLAAMELERALLGMAGDIAGLAIPVSDLGTERERVEAAHHRVRLVSELYRELGDAVRPNGH